MYIDGPNAMPVGGQTVWALDSLASATWTASAGSPTSGSGVGFGIWTAPGSPTTVRISATVSGETVYKDVVITNQELIGISPSLVVEGTIDDVTLIHRMENGGRRGRRKIPPKQSFELTFRSRTLTEYETVRDLFNAVGKLEPFGMYHPITDTIGAWYFDSAISQRYGGRGCSIDFSFRVQEA